MVALRINEKNLVAGENDGGYDYVYYYKNKPFTGVMIAEDSSFEQEYINGYKNGTLKTFYESGTLESDCITKHGCINGTYKEYYETGELKKLIEYNMDKISSGFEYDKSGKIIGTFPKKI